MSCKLLSGAGERREEMRERKGKEELEVESEGERKIKIEILREKKERP